MQEIASLDKFCPKSEQKPDEPGDFLNENLIFMPRWDDQVPRDTVLSKNVSFGEVATDTRVSGHFGFLQVWLYSLVGYVL